MYDEHTKRIYNMTLEAKSSLLDLEAYYKNDINATELEDFRNSLCNIESKASVAHTDLFAVYMENY